jgi:hypothetical protein
LGAMPVEEHSITLLECAVLKVGHPFGMGVWWVTRDVLSRLR